MNDGSFCTKQCKYFCIGQSFIFYQKVAPPLRYSNCEVTMRSLSCENVHTVRVVILYFKRTSTVLLMLKQKHVVSHLNETQRP